MLNNTTFCLGYWHVKDNIKRDINHYFKYIPVTLQMLEGKKIVFFYSEEEILDFIKQHIKTENFIPIHITTKNLPTYHISKDYLESCKKQNNDQLNRLYENNQNKKKEKGLVHYNREYMQSGEEAYRKIFSIWTSKVLLVDRIINENPFKTDSFAWIDVSIARFNGKRANWDFRLLKYSDKHISHYSSTMYCNAEKLNLNASFIYGYTNSWRKLKGLYIDQLESQKNSQYAHDEETLFNYIYKKNPYLFKKIDQITVTDKIKNKLKKLFGRLSIA